MDVLLGGYSESLSTTKHFEFQLHCSPCVYADKWICISKKVCVCLGQRWSPGLILVGLVSLRIQIRCLYLIPRNIFWNTEPEEINDIGHLLILWRLVFCALLQSCEDSCSAYSCFSTCGYIFLYIYMQSSDCTCSALAQRSCPCISPGAFQVHTLLNSLWSISDTEIRVTVLSRAWLVSYWNYARL